MSPLPSPLPLVARTSSPRRIGARGTHGDLIFVDEFSFVSDETLQTNVLATLCVDGRAVYVMSSPIHREAPRMQMLVKLDEHGRRVWNIIDLTTMCDACEDAGETDCQHLAENYAPWKSDKQRRLLKIVMDPHYYMTEIVVCSLSLPLPHLPRAHRNG